MTRLVIRRVMSAAAQPPQTALLPVGLVTRLSAQREGGATAFGRSKHGRPVYSPPRHAEVERTPCSSWVILEAKAALSAHRGMWAQSRSRSCKVDVPRLDLCAGLPVDPLAKQVDVPAVLRVLGDHPEHQPAQIDVLVPVQRPRGVVEVVSGDDLPGDCTLRAPDLQVGGEVGVRGRIEVRSGLSR